MSPLCGDHQDGGLLGSNVGVGFSTLGKKKWSLPSHPPCLHGVNEKGKQQSKCTKLGSAQTLGVDFVLTRLFTEVVMLGEDLTACIRPMILQNGPVYLYHIH